MKSQLGHPVRNPPRLARNIAGKKGRNYRAVLTEICACPGLNLHQVEARVHDHQAVVDLNLPRCLEQLLEMGAIYKTDEGMYHPADKGLKAMATAVAREAGHKTGRMLLLAMRKYRAAGILELSEPKFVCLVASQSERSHIRGSVLRDFDRLGLVRIAFTGSDPVVRWTDARFQHEVYEQLTL